VLSHWAGLRPLIYEEGKGPSELSRKDEIFVSDSGLITIAGGKLTGFRKMAEKVVNLVASQIAQKTGRPIPGCSTDQVIISGGERLGHSSYEDCKQELLRRGIALGVDTETAREWIETYGTNTLKIYDRLHELHAGETRLEDTHLLRAQLLYSIEEEMTASAADFLRLRTGWTFFQVQKAEAQAEAVIRIMAELLGWNEAEIERQRSEVQGLLATIYQLPANEQEISPLPEQPGERKAR
jgi:glycerol-3-phosphate dehydrogenase